MLVYSTVQCSTVQYSTIQYSRVKYSIEYNIVQCYCRVTVSCPMDPVVTEVNPNGSQEPGEGGVPGQLVEAVVDVHVLVGCEEEP